LVALQLQGARNIREHGALVGGIVENAAAVVAHGLSQSLGKLLVGLDAAIEANPFVGVQNCPVGIRHMMGKLKGDISVGRLPFVERQGAARGLKIDEMDGILELREGCVETADIDHWRGCVALPCTADLDAMALGSAPSARRRGRVESERREIAGIGNRENRSPWAF
jgi:hypothetical protein